VLASAFMRDNFTALAALIMTLGDMFKLEDEL
jgi:hypothetical protein